jgi:hypothetical protein
VCCHFSSSQLARLGRWDSSTLCSKYASCACDPAASDLLASALQCPRPAPTQLENRCNSRPCRAARSSASPHWLPAWWRRCRFACPLTIRGLPASPASRQRLADASPDRSACGCATRSSGPASSRSRRCPEIAVARASPLPARRCRARPRCPQNSRSKANESRCREAAMGDRTAAHRTWRTVLRRSRQSARRRITHSVFDKTDAPESLPIPCAQSIKTPAFADLPACPSPYSLDALNLDLYCINRRL